MLDRLYNEVNYGPLYDDDGLVHLAELALGSDIEKYIWHLLEPLNSAINFDLNINRFEVGKNRSITIDPPE